MADVARRNGEDPGGIGMKCARTKCARRDGEIMIALQERARGGSRSGEHVTSCSSSAYPPPAASTRPHSPAGDLNRCDPGVTLIEVMIALSVLSIAIMSLLTLLPTATKLINDSNEYEIARHAAEVQIAKIRAAGAAADATFAVPGLTPVAGATDDEIGSVIVTGGPDGTNEVQVLVKWTGTDKVDKRFVIVTLLR